MTIEIWNPKEMPFGSLSNSATYVMKIDDVNYTTVTNYIYSNLLSNKEYFQTLKNINTKDVYEYLNMYDKEYINSIISKSLKEATVQKFKNKELEEILLTTENYPIVFMSDDNILGSGKESLGQNLVGKVLMQIRDSVIAKEGEKEKKLYEAYTALQILEKSMFEEVSDLREFAGLNQKEIIEKYIYLKGVEKSKLQQNVDLSKSTYQEIINKYRYILKEPSKTIINTLLEGGEDNIKLVQLLEASLKRPYILILYVKKKYLSNLRFMQLKKLKDSIFDIYVNNILETKYPGLPKNKYEEAKRKEFSTSENEYLVIQNQIYELYKKKVLPKNVMEQIKLTVNTFVIPEKTVENIKNVNVDEIVRLSRPEDKKLVISFSSYSNSEETPYYVLSPFIYTGMLNINGLQYPSVMHYIMTMLFLTLPEVKDINSAHNLILLNPEGSQEDNLNYDSYEQLFYKYDNETYYQYNKLKKQFAAKGINKKFEDIGLQELLLATGNNELVWNDPYDEILGIGFSKGGENFVGKYLMEMRDKIKKNEEIIENIKQSDIKRIMENDIFMRSWSEMRLYDICKVVKEIKKYIIKKYGKTEYDVEIDSKFISDVLNKVYYQCNDLIPDFDKIKPSPPQYFRTLVRKCFGYNTSDDIVTLLWDRIVIMIYFISQHIPKLKNIKNVLAKIEIAVSAKNKCVKIIDNNDDNCIISAIVNILNKLNQFNESQGYSISTNKDDVATAINIILNRGGSKLDTNVPEFNTFTNIDEDNNMNVLNVGSFDIQDEPLIEKRDDDSEYEDYFEDADKRIVDDEDYDEEDNDDIYDTMYDLEQEEAQEEQEQNEDYGIFDGTRIKRPIPNPDRWVDMQKRMEEHLENIERMRFQKYKNANKIALFLDENGIISSNNSLLAEYIIDAIDKIKKFKMPYKVKRNRINFFATTD